MEERIKKIVEELKNDGYDVFIVVMGQSKTFTRTTFKDDTNLVRVAAALGRTAERRLKR